MWAAIRGQRIWRWRPRLRRRSLRPNGVVAQRQPTSTGHLCRTQRHRLSPDCHRRACSVWVCMDIEVERVLQAVNERLQRAGTEQHQQQQKSLETSVGA